MALSHDLTREGLIALLAQKISEADQQDLWLGKDHPPTGGREYTLALVRDVARAIDNRPD